MIDNKDVDLCIAT